MPHFNKLILFICVFVAPSLLAGTFEEAEKAYWNGQYTLAASIWEPMAKAGDADAQRTAGGRAGEGGGGQRGDRR